MELRKINPEDWELYRNFRLAALQSVDARAFGGSYEKESIRSEVEWKKRLEKNDRSFFYGFFDENKLLSTAGAYFNTHDDALQNKWIIVAVYTSSESRGQGLSLKTMTAVLDELKSRGVKSVTLMVNTKQESALRLYEKFGFSTVDLIKDELMGNGERHDEFVMEKSL